MTIPCGINGSLDSELADRSIHAIMPQPLVGGSLPIAQSVTHSWCTPKKEINHKMGEPFVKSTLYNFPSILRIVMLLASQTFRHLQVILISLVWWNFRERAHRKNKNAFQWSSHKVQHDLRRLHLMLPNVFWHLDRLDLLSTKKLCSYP